MVEETQHSPFLHSILRKIQNKTLLEVISNSTAHPGLARAGMTEQIGQIQETGEGSE